MARRKEPQVDNLPRRRKGRTEEARENELIALAYDLAEERLRNGTASAQEITELLKRGSTKARLEKQIMETQKELMIAKKEALQSSQRIEALYKDAIEAVRKYTPSDPDITNPILYED